MILSLPSLAAPAPAQDGAVAVVPGVPAGPPQGSQPHISLLLVGFSHTPQTHREMCTAKPPLFLSFHGSAPAGEGDTDVVYR